MVEGGAQVIRSFLLNSSIVQHIIVTIGPFYIGNGVKALGDVKESESLANSLPRLDHIQSLTLGQDIIVIGQPVNS